MQIKVRGGTPNASNATSLCYSCREALIVKGSNGQAYVYCRAMHWNELRVRMIVVECNHYDNKAAPTVDAMAKIAYVINSDKKAGKIGFMSPAERKAAGLKIGRLTHGDTTYLPDHNDD